MGIKMKFIILVSSVLARQLPACTAGGAGNGCGKGCGKGSDCMAEACCEGGNVKGNAGSSGCYINKNSCNVRRVLLKEEDDFDSLDDLELEETGDGGWEG